MATEPGNGSEPTVRLTVRELVELYGKQTVAEVRDLKVRVDALDSKVDDLDDKVADLNAADRASQAIRGRDDRSVDIAEMKTTQRKGQLITIIGIAAALLLGVTNMAVYLVIAHG